MTDYKERIQNFIEDLNKLISDADVFLNYSGGKFVVSVNIENGIGEASLDFIEKDIKHNVFKHKDKFQEQGVSIETFYQRLHFRVIRQLLFEKDHVDSNSVPHISFITLAHNGLSSLNQVKK